MNEIMPLLGDELILQIEAILIKYKKSLHKEWALNKSQANIDFRNFAAHELRDLVAKAQRKVDLRYMVEWLGGCRPIKIEWTDGLVGEWVECDTVKINILREVLRKLEEEE